MVQHLTRKPRHEMLKTHVLLGSVLVGCAVVLLHWPAMWRAIGSVAATSVALHAGVAVAVHIGVALGGAGILFAALRSHTRRRRDDEIGRASCRERVEVAGVAGAGEQK